MYLCLKFRNYSTISVSLYENSRPVPTKYLHRCLGCLVSGPRCSRHNTRVRPAAISHVLLPTKQRAILLWRLIYPIYLPRALGAKAIWYCVSLCEKTPTYFGLSRFPSLYIYAGKTRPRPGSPRWRVCRVPETSSVAGHLLTLRTASWWVPSPHNMRVPHSMRVPRRTMSAGTVRFRRRTIGPHTGPPCT